MSFLSKIKGSKNADMAICSAVIAAAGSSSRMDGGDKLFLEICGKPVLAHTLAVFQNCNLVDDIIVVVRADMIGRACDICKEYGIDKATKIIAGGETRFDSVNNGVFAVSPNAHLIAIHDGARPCIDIGIIEQTVITAAKYYAAAPAVPVFSTLKRVEGATISETIDREGVYEIQTPQVFEANIIKAALSNAASKSISITDDCMAVELLSVPVRITEGSRNNIKLTTDEDVCVAEAVLGGRARVRG